MPSDAKQAAVPSVLPDLRGASLAELAATGDADVAETLDRVLPTAVSNVPVAAFNSGI